MNSVSLFLIKGSELFDDTKKLNARGNLGSVLDMIPPYSIFLHLHFEVSLQTGNVSCLYCVVEMELRACFPVDWIVGPSMMWTSCGCIIPAIFLSF